MKRLFKENKEESFSKEALDLDAEIMKVVKPIVKKYIDMGYCKRDIRSIVIDAASEAILVEIVGWGD